MNSFVSAVLAATALYGSVDVSDHSEVRVHNEPGFLGPAVDVETVPALKVGLHVGRWEIAAGYAPHLTVLQNAGGAQPEVLHGASLAANMHGRTMSISFYEYANFGAQDFTSLAPEPTVAPGSPQFQPIPTAEVVRYAYSQTGCSATFSASRLWRFSASLGYGLSGGLDAVSRIAIPFQSGPYVSIGAVYEIDRRDSIDTSLDLSRTTFSSGQDDVVFHLAESWQHAWGRDTEWTLGAGIGWTETHDNESALSRSTPYPVATAALSHRFRPARVETQLSVQLSPAVDRLNGIVGEWLQGTASASWHPTRALAVEGQLGAMQSFTESQAGARAFVLDQVTVSYRLHELVDLAGGARSTWTSTVGDSAPSLLWVAFVGATIRAPVVRF